MLSLEEIKNYEFKKGIGYTKKSVDDYIAKVVDTYNVISKENAELQEKIVALSEGMQYYKSIEKTLQKSLVLAQKTADEKQEKALNKAKIIERVARTKADEIITKAKNDLDAVYRQTDELNRRFELYKSYIKNLINTQMDLINSDSYKISVNDLDGYLKLKDELEEARLAVPEDDEYSENIEDMSEDAKEDSESDLTGQFESTLEKIEEENIEHIPELKHKAVAKPAQDVKTASETAASPEVRQATTAKAVPDSKEINTAKPSQEKPITEAKSVQGIKPVKVPKINQDLNSAQVTKTAAQSAPVSGARHFAEPRILPGMKTAAEAKPAQVAKPSSDMNPAAELKSVMAGTVSQGVEHTVTEIPTSEAKSKSINNVRAGEMNAQERRVLLARKLAAEEIAKQEMTQQEHKKEQSAPINENLINRIPRDVFGSEDDVL